MNQLYVYMCPLPPSPSDPQAIIEPWDELPVLHNSFPLAICSAHGGVFMSIPVYTCQFLPPMPHRVLISILSIVSDRFICTIFLDSTYIC